MNKEEFKAFDRIIVKEEGVWRAALFSHYERDCHVVVVTTDNKTYGIGDYLPFEGNEYLIGTKNSPKYQKWRAKKGECYFYVNSDLLVTPKLDFGDCSDDIKYENGNYFRTSKEAELMAEKIRKILNNE